MNLLKNQFSRAGAAEICNARRDGSPLFSCCGFTGPKNRMLLELAGQGLGIGDAILVANECLLNHRIVKLDLSNNLISRAGCEALAELLPLHASGVLALNVASNELYDTSLQLLADALREKCAFKTTSNDAFPSHTKHALQVKSQVAQHQREFLNGSIYHNVQRAVHGPRSGRPQNPVLQLIDEPTNQSTGSLKVPTQCRARQSAAGCRHKADRAVLQVPL